MRDLHVHRIESVGSTQDEVRELLARHRAAAVLARRQQQGRGREGRRWHDPGGRALLLSVALRDADTGLLTPDLPARLLLEAIDVLVAGTGVERATLAVREPNDLVAAVDGAKLGGLLVDARTVGTRLDQLVIGLGVNLDHAPGAVDDRPVTSLAALGGRVEGDELDLAERVARRLHERLVGGDGSTAHEAG